MGFLKKAGGFFKTVGKALFVWGKPIIKKEINGAITPQLEAAIVQIKNDLKTKLQAKVNAGAIDKQVDAVIGTVVDEVFGAATNLVKAKIEEALKKI